MDDISVFFESLFESIRNDGTLAGSVIAGLGVLLLVAVIVDSDWVLEGGNGFFNIATISRMFGRTVARVLMGLLAMAIIFAGCLIAVAY
ncbi:Imm17 family immunity protein [Marinobacter zhejiangensis]|uniref:Immunity protein 17 n=1 Tax=Marinobacter zhejiangensis TaxID=488535 RepID=A0A1I4P538_9GAMM|nr:Imm17 family immunity protein [Marinobacter zhejiangensis]SFM22755.1 Immunity protein 17 [Marinobacter zhejiangensis]